MPNLSPGAIDELITAGVAAGGMRAKLEAAKTALADGVGSITIAPGQRPGIVRELLNGDGVGTLITA